MTILNSLSYKGPMCPTNTDDEVMHETGFKCTDRLDLVIQIVSFLVSVFLYKCSILCVPPGVNGPNSM